MTAGHRTRHAELGEVTLALDEWPASRGRPVLFLHATGFSRGVWRPAAEGLLDVCRPIALDLRGHGESRTTQPAGDWTAMAGDIERLAGREGWSELMIVGHSLGGGVGMLLALERPELVSALVLVEAPLRPSAGGRPSEMVEIALRRRYEWPSREEAAAHLRARSPYDSWEPAVFAGFVETGLRTLDGRDGTAGAVELACRRGDGGRRLPGQPPGRAPGPPSQSSAARSGSAAAPARTASARRRIPRPPRSSSEGASGSPRATATSHRSSARAGWERSCARRSRSSPRSGRTATSVRRGRRGLGYASRRSSRRDRR